MRHGFYLSRLQFIAFCIARLINILWAIRGVRKQQWNAGPTLITQCISVWHKNSNLISMRQKLRFRQRPSRKKRAECGDPKIASAYFTLHICACVCVCGTASVCVRVCVQSQCGVLQSNFCAAFGNCKLTTINKGTKR